MNRTLQLGSRTTKPINGFPRVAQKLASDPDRTTTIFRRFDQLSSRNLLFLEAELAELEALQKRADEDDLRYTDRTTIECHSDWRKFEQHATEKDVNEDAVHPKQAERLNLALKIKKRLGEYHEALAVHQVLLNAKAPALTTINAMRNWFLGGESWKTQPRPQLWGSSATMFDDPNDLIALRVPADQDRLSGFILNHFGRFFATDRNSDENSAHISERRLATVVAITSSILSAILLFGSITSLYFVHNPYAILGMLGGWTVLFAISVGWLTNAKRDSVFAATAAYSAVLVVFVSGNLGGAPPPSSVVLGSWNCTQV